AEQPLGLLPIALRQTHLGQPVVDMSQLVRLLATLRQLQSLEGEVAGAFGVQNSKIEIRENPADLGRLGRIVNRRCQHEAPLHKLNAAQKVTPPTGELADDPAGGNLQALIANLAGQLERTPPVDHPLLLLSRT